MTTASVAEVRESAVPWVAPFATFMLLLGVLPSLGVPQPWDATLRIVVPALVLLATSRRQLAALRLRAGLILQDRLGEVTHAPYESALTLRPDRPRFRYSMVPPV